MGFFSKVFKSTVRAIKKLSKPLVKAIPKALKSPIISKIASFVPGGSATLGLVKGLAGKLIRGSPIGKIVTGIGAVAAGFGPSIAVAGGTGMSLLGNIIRKGGAVATGAALGAAVAGDKKKKRRARKRLTNREITELMQLKMLFGARSPIVTMAGLKMLNRGG